MGIRSWWDRFNAPCDTSQADAAIKAAREADEKVTALLAGGPRRVYVSTGEYTPPPYAFMVCEATNHTIPTVSFPAIKGYKERQVECETCHATITVSCYTS